MSTKIKPQLSKKSKYYISKNRYKELMYFCLQYPEWLDEMSDIGIQSHEHSEIKEQSYLSDTTANQAIKLTILSEKIKLVEQTALETDSYIYQFILIAVTEGYTYNELKTVRDIPCSRGYFYERYRRFFWLLSHKKHSL